MTRAQKFRQPADAAESDGGGVKLAGPSPIRGNSDHIASLPGRVIPSANSDVSGGGPADRSATPAPFNDDLLMDPEQMRRFIHSHDLNEREVGKDHDMSWRDLAIWMLGYWPGVLSGFAFFAVVAVGLVLIFGFDWR